MLKWLKRQYKIFKSIFEPNYKNYNFDLSFPPIHERSFCVEVKKPAIGNYSSLYKRRGKLQKVVTKMYVGANCYRETIEWVEERK